MNFKEAIELGLERAESRQLAINAVNEFVSELIQDLRELKSDFGVKWLDFDREIWIERGLNQRILCGIELAETGFPIRIEIQDRLRNEEDEQAFRDATVVCPDAESLRAALIDVLSSPETGLKLRAML